MISTRYLYYILPLFRSDKGLRESENVKTEKKINWEKRWRRGFESDIISWVVSHLPLKTVNWPVV